MPPYPNVVSVKKYNGTDCWRTWFIKECERYSLFGVTTGNRYRINEYKIGTLIYLEDAPYFKTFTHRICGPYIVKKSTPICDYEIKDEDNDGKIIIYKDHNPKNGPWFDKSSVTRFIRNRDFTYRQDAKRFDFFPLRFSIDRAPDFAIIYIRHKRSECNLCSND